MTTADARASGPPGEFHVVALEEFAAVDEPGTEALLGSKDAALIAEGSDTMIYGDGGAGKTTLTVDLALHLAVGIPWLGIPVARPLRVLVIENEGPRAPFRQKVRRKLARWEGPALDGHVLVFDRPWGEFTFTDEYWRTALAARIRRDEIDVMIAGPLTRLGMDDAGTLQQARDFMRLVHAVRAESGRCLAVILVHHQNKGGTVSGAWEGAGDTLLHVEGHGHGHTRLHIQKARWSSEHHGARLTLAWTEGEGFTVAVAMERDLTAEIAGLLADRKWRTVSEIADKKKGGIGAAKDTVRSALQRQPDRFIERTGKDVGRSPNATVYGLTSPQKPVEPVIDTGGTGGGTGLLASPKGKPVGPGPVPAQQLELVPVKKPVGDDESPSREQKTGIEGATTAQRETRPRRPQRPRARSPRR